MRASGKLFSAMAPPPARRQTPFYPAPKSGGAPFVVGVGWLVRKEEKGGERDKEGAGGGCQPSIP